MGRAIELISGREIFCLKKKRNNNKLKKGRGITNEPDRASTLNTHRHNEVQPFWVIKTFFGCCCCRPFLGKEPTVLFKYFHPFFLLRLIFMNMIASMI
jgi:hypothetical protein